MYTYLHHTCVYKNNVLNITKYSENKSSNDKKKKKKWSLGCPHKTRTSINMMEMVLTRSYPKHVSL